MIDYVGNSENINPPNLQLLKSTAVPGNKETSQKKTASASLSLSQLKGFLYEEISENKNYPLLSIGCFQYALPPLQNQLSSPAFQGNYMNWYYYMHSTQSIYQNMYNLILQNYMKAMQNMPQFQYNLNNYPLHPTYPNQFNYNNYSFTGKIVNPIGKGEYWVSSEFGVQRPGHTHKGTDLAANYGTPVRACTDGIIEYTGYDKGYGNWIELRHSDGSSSRYGHLSAILVNTGSKIPAGTIIGKVGSSGISTGPHLHFEWRENNGQATNPRFRVNC